MDLFSTNLHEHIDLFENLIELGPDVERVSETVAASLGAGGKLLICGNGGSASDSQHMAAEFTGRFIKDRPPMAAIALSTDTSALTCIGNDYSFDEVFSRQVHALGRPGDCLIGISTSGNSLNVLNALEAANSIGMTTIGLLGRDGGKIVAICKHSIVVPNNVTARIQEAHILIIHTICGSVEMSLGLV
jgi:D-sedoheptulose 7-phosphate isomerase